MSAPLDAAVDLSPREPVLTETAPRKRPFSRGVREAGLGYLLLLPAFLIFSVFIFYPFLRNFYLGFFSTPPFPGQPKHYVGLDQYKDVLSSSDFLDSLRTTVTFVIITVAAVIFGTLLSPQVGLLHGIQTEPSILQNPSPIIDINLPVIRSFIPSVSLTAVAVTTIWQNLGLSFILMSAGLQAVPDELQEAAEIDGASPWSRFRSVTLPLLSPTIFFAFVVGSIFAFQAFGQIDLLTPRGGPLKTTNVLVYYIYDQLQFAKNDGKAAVLAIALFGVTFLLTMVQFQFLERRVSYER